MGSRHPFTRCAAAAALLILAGCSSGGSDPAPVTGFTQADLAGDWDILQLSTNDAAGWADVVVRIAASGQVTVLSFLDDAGDTGLPPTGFDLKALIAEDGTVRLAGADGDPTFHGTMTAARTLVFGTGQEGAPVVRRNLYAWRKRVPGLTYSAADLAGRSFAFHGLYAGAGVRWTHGAASTDAAGVLTVGEFHASDGVVMDPGAAGTLSVDAAGVVRLDDGAAMRGVMAPEKNAVFLVHLSGDPAAREPGFLVLQRTGRSFAQADLAGDWALHLVYSGASVLSSGWNHGADSIDASGTLTFSAFENSAGSTALPASRRIALSSGGRLTTDADPTYLGQLSWDGDFYVRISGGATNPSLGINAR
ncbi:conserved hypothetical protein [Anaeromyxobacter sp. K]|uniref:hypothetical protein n=1 Tax=Anaeromyxobacter sp. (strain K) TaxID=447217 RepID=UPI00015F9FF6|nr:hypothetical protein [Anaeromyxobacter sp. K]ACG72369.1 conserved hypothetical protein [Anaeromyxobacter sp. K]